jgi:hypothetical protein
MKVNMSIDGGQLTSFFTRSSANMMSSADVSVKKAAREALEESLAQVPKVTGTLADSAFMHKIGNAEYMIGYGDSSSVNPKSKRAASDYMVQIHEDMALQHEHGGKAKFLEDPVNQYAEDFQMEVVAALQEGLK